MNQATDKQLLRKTLLRRRSQMPAEDRAALSLQAQHFLLASGLWRTANKVALYAAIRGEVDTGLLFEKALQANKAVFFPRVRANEAGLMDFVQVKSPNDLVPGSFGILEPAPALPGLAAQDFSCDLVVVPGSAFTLQGQRLGYGGGYYDRFFTACPTRTRIGFCYSLQLLPVLDADPWDVCMTHVCTEKGLTAAGQ